MECPDGGACHHDCGDVDACFRVRTCGPLSGVFPGDEWPAALVSKATLARARQTLAYYEGREHELTPNVQAALDGVISATAVLEVQQEAVSALFVGGNLDGQVLPVDAFRESDTPDEYEAMTTWSRGVGENMFHEGIAYPLVERFEVVYWRGLPVPMGMTEPQARSEFMLRAMAKALGILTGPMGHRV